MGGGMVGGDGGILVFPIHPTHSFFIKISFLIMNKKRSRSDQSAKEGPKSKKRKRDPNAPKRPITAFFLFSAKHRDSLKLLTEYQKISKAGKKICNLTKMQQELGRRWRGLKDDEKHVYQKKHRDLNVIYKKQLKLYQEKKEKEVEEKRNKRKKRRRKKKRRRRREIRKKVESSSDSSSSSDTSSDSSSSNSD